MRQEGLPIHHPSLSLGFVMNKIFWIVVLAIIPISLKAQEKLFFDANGKSTGEASAFYYRTCKGVDCKSFYLSGKPYFEGKIPQAHPSDESKNQYQGTCTWYYKNGKKAKVRTFSPEGKEDGTSTYYFESGNTSRIERYQNGVLVNGSFEEYDENGIVNRVFFEDFSNNSHDWDLYVSNQSKASISGGVLTLESTQKTGSSRFLNMPFEGDKFSFEIDIVKTDYKLGRQGFIFGHKDWQNYWYFSFQKGFFTIGHVVEGVTITEANEFFCSVLQKEPETVRLKVISNGSKFIFSVNSEIQFSSPYSKLPGRNFGPIVGGKGKMTIDQMVFKELNIGSGSDERVVNNKDDAEKWEGSGTGFFIHESGLIATNHHVVEDMKEIEINFTENMSPKKYKAKVLVSDKDNDVSILQIDDPKFKSLEPLKYSFKTGSATNPGASVFSIGYPMFNVLGIEPKFSDGKISSKTGYKNSVNSFQTTVPIQPGNSGSPLFNDRGEVIGIANAIIKDADNVSYAIKISYLLNLMDLLPNPVTPPARPIATETSLEDKIKILTQYVTLIKVR